MLALILMKKVASSNKTVSRRRVPLIKVETTAVPRIGTKGSPRLTLR